ncbi:hypothetical protein NHF40_11135, partial [Maricaulaceae bacterium EIL42A08]|nr:hypothetical protein [Maricaulaceae bacterium EIL42A08]
MAFIFGRKSYEKEAMKKLLTASVAAVAINSAFTGYAFGLNDGSEDRDTDPTDFILPSYGQINPFYGDINPFYGQINPFYGQISPFWGDVTPFWGQINPFY